MGFTSSRDSAQRSWNNYRHATRRYGSTGTISVHFSTASGSATAASDFVPTSGELTWGDGDTFAKKIEVQIIDDSVDESVERFEVRLTSPTGGATVTRSRLGVAIHDNDPGSGGGSGTLDLVNTASTVSEGGAIRLGVRRAGRVVRCCERQVCGIVRHGERGGGLHG